MSNISFEMTLNQVDELISWLKEKIENQPLDSDLGNFFSLKNYFEGYKNSESILRLEECKKCCKEFYVNDVYKGLFGQYCHACRSVYEQL